MWHEARKQERKIRGLMVDYKKRAERRREFYEKIKLDPAQFVHVYGRPCKIHLDAGTAMAAEGPQSMMPWQGQQNNMIDRFDVRAHLDFIPEWDGKLINPYKSKLEEDEERQCNYERYRSLVENEAAGLTEEQSLHQIYLDEQFGSINQNNEDEDLKKKKSDNKAAIGFVYEDSTPAKKSKGGGRGGGEESDGSDESSDTDIEAADLDVTLDVDMLTPEQTVVINKCAEQYGMKDDDYIRLLRRDKEEIEALRQAKLMEEEKAQFSGRKSRRERRAYKDRRLMGRKVSPPSYAARDSPKYEPYKKSSSSSRSRSRSPEGPAKVMFITSFGEEEEHPIQGPCLPGTDNSHKSDSKGKSRPLVSSSLKKTNLSSTRRRRSSSSSSRSRSRSRRSNSGSRNRRSGSSPKHSSRHSKSSRNTDRNYHRARTRSRSRSRRSRSSSSRSRSSSYSSSSSRSSRSRSRSSRSKSPSPKPVIKSYRRESLSSKSDSSSDEDNDRKRKSLNQNTYSKRPTYGASVGKSSSLNQLNKLTPQERMKKKMQAALSKQFKVDKKVELEKTEKSMQERLDREEDLRVRSLEMRRREREKRHKEMEDYDRRRSRSRSPVRSRYRSRSRSPRSRHSRRSRS